MHAGKPRGVDDPAIANRLLRNTVGVLDEPLDVRSVEARDLMKVVDAQPVQRALEVRVDGANGRGVIQHHG